MDNLLLSKIFKGRLEDLSNRKLLINTINAHSFNVARKDSMFYKALQSGDILLPDGVSVIFASRLLFGIKIKKIAGADLFYYEMKRLDAIGGSCFFLGSNGCTLQKIYDKAKIEFPNLKVHNYSPPYKPVFSKEDSQRMIELINAVKPDVVFIGMTAPKQEKWAFTYFNELDTKLVCCIGAVFDFYAGNIQRAPKWAIKIGLEWLFRLLKEPRRLSKRYIIGNTKFVLFILRMEIAIIFSRI
ncbi:MAG: WecB/TagA/CpsF family glycosyltransferase [Ginsengibacter sp.]